MRIYVTGSTGMVGKNLVETFSARGHDVVTSLSKDVDLLDYGATASFIRRAAPDLIVHAAGKVGGIQANIKDSYGFFTANMQMGMNVVNAALEARVPRMFNLSSSCSYPCALERTLREDDVFAGKLEPTNEGYAIAKAAVLRLCAFVSRQFPECRYKTLVPCNLYGRHDKFGESNSHMIPAVIRKLHEAKAQGAPSVSIWGDGEARREFLFATDLAEMIEECVRRFDEIPDVMNIGVGRDHTVNEYYETIAGVVGYGGRFEHDLSRPVGMKRKLLDVSRQEALGIRPRRTLEEGVRETYDWFLDFGGGRV